MIGENRKRKVKAHMLKEGVNPFIIMSFMM